MLESAAVTPDLIVINGNIRTLDPSQRRTSGLVCHAGELVFVGDADEALSYRTRHSEVVDARGRLVLPGFADAHIHFTGFAQSLDRVNLEGCRSVEEAVARVAAGAAAAREGETILGGGWNHLDWTVPTFPDKRPLDAVAPNHPVILTRKDGHSAWVNSAALRQLQITRETPVPEGGRLERDANGELTGLVREKAMELLGRGIGKSDEEIPQGTLRRAIEQAHRAGLTAIHNIEGANALRAWQSLHAHGKLKLRVIHSIPGDSVEYALALGLERGFGDDWLRLQAVKLFADGSLGSLTAQMHAPFVGTDTRGMALTDHAALLRLARQAARGGLDVWIHAIGDAAISRTLDVFALLRGEGWRDSIFRIEHAQHLNPADLPRFAQFDVIASMQPIHQPSDMKMADEFLGPERVRFTYAFNSLRQAGATLAFGSDCPVERFEPLRGILAAATRQNELGEPRDGWIPEERLSVEAAVEGFTRGAALAAGDGTRAGMLAVGCRADMVILSQDIFEIPPREMLNTQVDYTLVGGEVVFCREN